MVPAPPQTDLALQSIDPRRLRASFQRGMAAMQKNDSDETTKEGAGTVSMAAVLGYEPARVTIAREYPRSSTIRSATSSAEAVRYSLDPLFIPGSQSESNRISLVLLASYFSGRHELPAYATDLLATLTDDQRLRLRKASNLCSDCSRACLALARPGSRGSQITNRDGSGMLARLAASA